MQIKEIEYPDGRSPRLLKICKLAYQILKRLLKQLCITEYEVYRSDGDALLLE
jgi:hypothetical protein